MEPDSPDLYPLDHDGFVPYPVPQGRAAVLQGVLVLLVLLGSAVLTVGVLTLLP